MIRVTRRNQIAIGGKSAAGGEEILEQGCGFFGEDAGDNFDTMVEAGIAQEGEAGADSAGFGIVCAVDEAGDARLNHGTGAHGAGLDGDVEVGAEEAVSSDRVCGFAEHDNFGVRGGVAIRDRAVAGARDDSSKGDDDGADGDFAGEGGLAGLVEGGAHEGKPGIARRGHARRG